MIVNNSLNVLFGVKYTQMMKIKHFIQYVFQVMRLNTSKKTHPSYQGHDCVRVETAGNITSLDTNLKRHALSLAKQTSPLLQRPQSLTMGKWGDYAFVWQSARLHPCTASLIVTSWDLRWEYFEKILMFRGSKNKSLVGYILCNTCQTFDLFTI